MPQPAPTLLQFLYGDGAQAALPSASPRLLAWCQAFDEWLAWREANNSRSTYDSSRRSWRRLLSRTGKPPWELDQDDLEEHIRWLRDQGLTLSTIKGYLSAISHFYRWCKEGRIDPACPPGFNPALDLDQLKGRARPTARAKPTLTALNREEARALLSLFRQDSTLLGQRDCAFFLARLRLGTGLDALRSLQWGQIEAEETGARVRWQPAGKWRAFPEDVWQAILRYLGAAGRLETIQPDDYIFAPLQGGLAHEPAGLAEDWNPTRAITVHHLLSILKLYGGQPASRKKS